jgi:5-methyltetrahydropteroyltriglutamate--homocysteine methyltransferase
MGGALLTSSVGSFPKPPYLMKARSEFAAGRLSEAELAELGRQATREVIALQEELGIDIFVHGEEERGDMVAYFAEKLPSMKLGGLVRAYGNRYYHKPVITGKLQWLEPLTLESWQYAQSLTDKPVKGMVTGPYTMVEWSFNDYYDDRREMIMDMAQLVRQEVLALERAGAKYIQIDEPAVHTRPEEDLDLAIEAVGVVTEGVNATTLCHICYGDVDKIYPAMLRLAVDEIDLALKNSDFKLLDLFRDGSFTKAIGAGVTDVHSHRIESLDEVEDGIRQVLEVFPPQKVYVIPDCGLKTRTWDEAADKLRVMVQATRKIKQELGIE